jgi:hypothetical protein
LFALDDVGATHPHVDTFLPTPTRRSVPQAFAKIYNSGLHLSLRWISLSAGMEAIIESLGECHFFLFLLLWHVDIVGFSTFVHRFFYDDFIDCL